MLRCQQILQLVRSLKVKQNLTKETQDRQAAEAELNFRSILSKAQETEYTKGDFTPVSLCPLSSLGYISDRYVRDTCLTHTTNVKVNVTCQYLRGYL